MGRAKEARNSLALNIIIELPKMGRAKEARNSLALKIFS